MKDLRVDLTPWRDKSDSSTNISIIKSEQRKFEAAAIRNLSSVDNTSRIPESNGVVSELSNGVVRSTSNEDAQVNSDSNLIPSNNNASSNNNKELSNHISSASSNSNKNMPILPYFDIKFDEDIIDGFMIQSFPDVEHLYSFVAHTEIKKPPSPIPEEPSPSKKKKPKLNSSCPISRQSSENQSAQMVPLVVPKLANPEAEISKPPKPPEGPPPAEESNQKREQIVRWLDGMSMADTSDLKPPTPIEVKIPAAPKVQSIPKPPPLQKSPRKVVPQSSSRASDASNPFMTWLNPQPRPAAPPTPHRDPFIYSYPPMDPKLHMMALPRRPPPLVSAPRNPRWNKAHVKVAHMIQDAQRKHALTFRPPPLHTAPMAPIIPRLPPPPPMYTPHFADYSRLLTGGHPYLYNPFLPH